MSTVYIADDDKDDEESSDEDERKLNEYINNYF